MNLKPLFDTQKKLMERIEKEHPAQPGEDRFSKKILALLVEVGECANEWRGFKFWSKDQTPRTNKARGPYMELEDADFYNPLLEEYVDGLHFVLELGIDKEFIFERVNILMKTENVTNQFVYIMDVATDLVSLFNDEATYFELIQAYLGLGEMLGFTWDEIEAAYFAKNAINFERQQNGY